MARILVVESEAGARASLGVVLAAARHSVFSCTSAEEAVRLARKHVPDVAVVDLALRERPALEVCRAMKRHPKTAELPIVAIADRMDVLDELALRAMDDFVVKPFAVSALLARIEIVQRMRAARSIIELGILRVNRARHEAFVDGEPVRLTRVELRLLLLLCDNSHRVLTRADLLRDVWNMPDQETRRTDTQVRRLRRALGKAGAYIRTVRGIGYGIAPRPPTP